MADRTKTAPESTQVKRARDKLEKLLEKEHEMINPKTIEEATRNIRRWLNRHASERINIRDRTIRLFDSNQHSEKSSSYVKNLRANLAGEFATEKAKEAETKWESLRGRFSIEDEYLS